jgi:hypothetical protein
LPPRGTTPHSFKFVEVFPAGGIGGTTTLGRFGG